LDKGWRLERNLGRGEYCYLIGANNWAIELQENEFKSLYEVSNKLIREFREITNQLMEEEIVNIEIEMLSWYAELEGTKNQWSMKFVYESNECTRSFEMYWPIQIAETLFFEIRKMWESMYSKN
tara:strand:+ start:1128 stop:1499 length:372 start_codon:yes stop_codon:yes gene_type:complete